MSTDFKLVKIVDNDDWSLVGIIPGRSNKILQPITSDNKTSLYERLLGNKSKSLNISERANKDRVIT